MRSFSYKTLVALCALILCVDLLAFYWLQSITQWVPSAWLRGFIHTAFWVFTIGLITSILLLKSRLAHLHPKQRHLLISGLYGLSVSSFVPKLIFVVVITVLYFSNFIFSERESVIVVPLVGLGSGLLPFLAVVYGILRTLYRFKVHRLTIRFRQLPPDFNGLKIVHISDLHLGSFNARYALLEKAVKRINALAPDLIFFTGDLVNNYAWELKGWRAVLQPLSAKMGKYAVLGNHDYGDYSQWPSDRARQSNFELIKHFHKQIGFKLLLNAAEVIEKETGKIAVVGVENWGLPPFKAYGDLVHAMRQVGEVPFKILLSHDPSRWEKEVVGKTEVQLTLSGHTHGMQAGIRFAGRQWSPIQYKYKHWAGLYHQAGQYLYVNRGLGWLGFPGRVGMRPEITCLELKKSD